MDCSAIIRTERIDCSYLSNLILFTKDTAFFKCGLRISIRGSVRPSVRPSVGRSVRNAFFFNERNSMFVTQITSKTPYHCINIQPNEWTTIQMNGQNKLTIKTKERAKQLNELTNELVAASLFDSNLFMWFLDIRTWVPDIARVSALS